LLNHQSECIQSGQYSAKEAAITRTGFFSTVSTAPFMVIVAKTLFDGRMERVFLLGLTFIDHFVVTGPITVRFIAA